MTLTHNQADAVRKGESVVLDVDGIPCVLVRQDVFENVRRAAEPSPRASYPAVLKALDQDDESAGQYLEYLDE